MAASTAGSAIPLRLDLLGDHAQLVRLRVVAIGRRPPVSLTAGAGEGSEDQASEHGREAQ